MEDLSKERFQRLVDSQVNNMTYNTKTKSADINRQWSHLVDRWKSIGVNIKGHKVNNKYIVNDVTLDYDNYIIRNLEQYKQSRNNSLSDDKINQCGYIK
jgi:hypothetical protein